METWAFVRGMGDGNLGISERKEDGSLGKRERKG
jgi:hypothetical protein